MKSFKKIRIKSATATTTPGYANENGQSVIRDTGFPSETFNGQRIYHMRCARCGGEYGSNGCDVHLRRCPGCQGGSKGEPLPVPGPSLFDHLEG